MKKNNVILCDDCKERVSHIKCSICKNDTCPSCKHTLYIEVEDESNYVYLSLQKSDEGRVSKFICKSCRENIHNMISNVSKSDISLDLLMSSIYDKLKELARVDEL